ncbi:MAG TPA: patatin-like phospholipase family protein [Bacteroidia bacterium]|nr:patatin-like phospholipase family protein [Bacteroidia bacterium]
MKHLGISGGGTKIVGLFAAAEVIIREKNYKPDLISGISAGAILSVPLAMRMWDKMHAMLGSIKLDAFFNVLPVKEDGSFRPIHTLWQIITGKHYLGEQYNLEKTLSKVITQTDFTNYKTDNTFATCVVGSVDFIRGERVYINLKQVSYENFLSMVNASSSLPVFTPGIKHGPINDFEGTKRPKEGDRLMLFDGGVRDHAPTLRMLESKQWNITETCTIFSRPKNNEILKPSYKDASFPKNILEVLNKFVDISNTEISKDDECLEEDFLLANPKIIDHGRYFLPPIMNGVYDVDPSRLKQLFDAGQLNTRNDWDAHHNRVNT